MASAGFVPIKVIEVEIDRPLSDLKVDGYGDPPAWPGLKVLVRLHDAPLGIIETTTSGPVLSAGELAARIQHELGEVIAAHLAKDRLDGSQPLTARGLPAKGQPECVAKREALLKDAPSASVIIATRNRADRLSTTLDTVLGQDYPDFEVVVVDNASSNDNTKVLLETQYRDRPNLKYVREDRPGLASAHNAGLVHADGEIMAFADDDLRIDRQWLAILAAAFKSMDHVGCVTGMIMPMELEEPAQLWFDQYGRLNKGLEQQIFDLDAHRRESPLYPYAAGSFGSGANMAFSREALDAIGGFDTAMGTGTSAKGGDDLAAFFDVIVAGFRLIYEPAALVWHSHPSKYEQLKRQAYGYGMGLTAYLTRTVARHPRHALTMLVRLPRGVDHILNPASPKNVVKPADYPGELDRLERLGMLAGPFGYIRSRWETRAWSSIEAYRQT